MTDMIDSPRISTNAFGIGIGIGIGLVTLARCVYSTKNILVSNERLLLVAACVLLACIFGFGSYVAYVFQRWEIGFAGNRLNRTDVNCPSNKQPPKVSDFDTTKTEIVSMSGRLEAFKSCKLIDQVKVMERVGKGGKRRRSMTRRASFNELIVETEEEAQELDMDHIYIRFFDFFWGFVFIGPMSYLLWKRGTTWLAVRKKLTEWGVLKVPECNIERLVGTLCLEQSQVIHYVTATKDDNDHVAGFFFSSFPYVDNDCNYRVADLFAVHIDLDTKCFVRANLDNLNLTASETLILLWFNTIAAQHVKLHALANWGVNNSPDVKEANPFLYQNSVVTIIYNYFGYSTFSNFLKTWENQGLLKPGWSESNCLIKCFNHGIKGGVRQHSQITDLMKHSRFVRFVVKVRSIFIKEFGQHKHLFPGVDGEALFVGTVLHSLDHTLMEWNMVDPLWLDVDDPRFGTMAQLGRLVRVGFVEDVPLLYFQKRFKGSRHPFYEAVYKKAARIDKELADNMDTCIIK